MIDHGGGFEGCQEGGVVGSCLGGSFEIRHVGGGGCVVLRR